MVFISKSDGTKLSFFQAKTSGQDTHSMKEQEKQALYVQLIGECQAEIMSLVEGTPMEERIRNDPMKLSAVVQKIVRQAMGAPQKGPAEPTEQDVRRSIRSQIESLKRQLHVSQTLKRAMEMIEALADFKLMLNATVAQNDKELLNKAVKFLEDLPRTPEGKPKLDKKQLETTIWIDTNIYQKVKEWKERQTRGQQPIEPGSVPMPPAMAPPQAPHPQAMQASPMPPMPPVNQPVAMPPPNHPHAKPMHGGVYQQMAHPQDHQQVRKPDVPPSQSCDEWLTKLFKSVRNDTAVFYSTPHPPHI